MALKHEYRQSIENNEFSDEIESSTPLKYNAIDDETNSIIFQISKEIKGEKELCSKLKYRGVTYDTGMYICVGTSESADFLICKIKLIVVDKCLMNIYFIGHTKEIIFNSDVGVYELKEYDERDTSRNTLYFYPYSSLLSPEPLLQYFIKTVEVYLPKYSPFEED